MSETINTKQFLTFKLGQEQYGLDVLRVREVLEVPQVTRVPRMPGYIRGVINIRGTVLTVIDLREKLDLETIELSNHSRVIIVEVKISGDDVSVGILVDSVQEVLEIKTDAITPSPHIGTAIDAAYIEGISKQDNGFIMLLNIDLIFHEGEISAGKLTTAELDDEQEKEDENFAAVLDAMDSEAHMY